MTGLLATSVALACEPGAARHEPADTDSFAEIAPFAHNLLAAALAAASSATQRLGCGPYAIGADQAVALARRAAPPDQKLVLMSSLSCLQPYFVLGEPDVVEDSPLPRWRVNAQTGSLEGGALYIRHPWASLERLQAETELIDRIARWPEVQLFRKQIAAASAGQVTLTMRIEDCPAPTGPASRYEVYVGEQHGTHTVRWVTVWMKSPGGPLSVSSHDWNELPYEQWRRTSPR